MYLEVSVKKYEKLKEKLDELNIPYTINNYSISNGNVQVYRFDFGALTPPDIKKITELYENVSEEIYQKETPNGHYEKKWDKTYHTPMQEIVGHITGEANEEEYVYEN